MDKAIAKVNQIQNELYWYENIFQQCSLYLISTGYSLTAHSYLKSKFKMALSSSLGSDHLDRDVCVNFIKTIFQILRNVNDVIGKVQFSNCVCKYQTFLQKKQDK
jgi:hypothetical protein